MATLRKLNDTTGLRLTIAAIVGVIAGFIGFDAGLGRISILIGWDASVLVFVIWVLAITLPLNANKTARFAVRDDPSRLGADLILILASFASIGAVAAALFEAHSDPHQAHALLLTAISILSVLLSWLLIHTIFTVHYARIYYTEGVEGTIDFGEGHKPTYWDFLYVAFTVGMTYQIADTTVTGTALRRTVIRHALLSYVFGTIIVATTVSVIAGLGSH